ncbi:MAG: TfoX/Sxy family protein [Actinomycetota bacterium]
MAYDEDLAGRIREAIGARRGVDEIKMFGGLCFTIGGNMACGILRGDLLVRVSAEDADRLLERPGARPMEMMKGRPAKGFIVVDAEAVGTKAQLQRWIDVGIDVAASLPRKAKKKPKKR